MIVEAYQKEDGYYIPKMDIFRNKKKVKVDINFIDDDLEEAINEHYYDKDKRSIILQIDKDIFNKFLEKNNLKG